VSLYSSMIVQYVGSLVSEVLVLCIHNIVLCPLYRSPFVGVSPSFIVFIVFSFCFLSVLCHFIRSLGLRYPTKYL